MRLPIQILAILYRRKESALEILLFKRIPEKGGFWLSISGGMEESDQSVLETCYREIKEEADIDRESILKVDEKIYIFQFTETIKNKENTNYRALNTDQLTMTTYVYGFELKPGIEPKLLEEHTEYKWCSVEEAKGLLKYEDTFKGIEIIANNFSNL